MLSDCTWIPADCSPNKFTVFLTEPDPYCKQDVFLCNPDSANYASPVHAPPIAQDLSPLIFEQVDHLQSTPFTDRYHLSSPWISPDSYISPVVRASSIGSDHETLDRLYAAAPASTDSSPERPLAEVLSLPPFSLLSPCKALFTDPTTPNTTNYFDLFSPLTPLTPGPLTIKIPKRENKKNVFTPQPKTAKRKRIEQDSPTPPPRPKYPRRTLRSAARPLQTYTTPISSPSPVASPESPSPIAVPVFTTRTFPSTLNTSPLFPLFYRRFPASSFFQTSPTSSPCALSGAAHPGGTYNAPRSPLDLYTPRFVKGIGVEKVGLCPICIEPTARGGTGHKVWLGMKFSAFKCYHMQYMHGICAATGIPYSPPTDFRTTQRPHPGKNERTHIQEAKCHKCTRWVPLEGTKAVEMKVKELFWWKHAAVCHQTSTLDGEGGVYEQDEVYELLLELNDAA